MQKQMASHAALNNFPKIKLCKPSEKSLKAIAPTASAASTETPALPVEAPPAASHEAILQTPVQIPLPEPSVQKQI